MTIDTLGKRALNRALLERQLLLRRRELPTSKAIEHLVGLQAQNPNDPYFGLLARLDSFHQDELAELLINRTVVRASMMRATIHLVTARDCVMLRPIVQPVLERDVYRNSTYGKKRLEGLDMTAVLAAGRALLEEDPRSAAELRELLGPKWPDYDAAALAYAVRGLLPIVHVPPRGIWDEKGPIEMTTVENWLGQSVDPNQKPEELIRRYLGAFGPATVADMRTWSGLTGLGDIVDRLRPDLRTFSDMDGKELFDLSDAPRPDPDIPVPPRFLPRLDNLVLSHADRTHIIPAEYHKRVIHERSAKGTVLIDGFVGGFWNIQRNRDAVTLLIEPFEPVEELDQDSLTAEGTRLLIFAAPDTESQEIEFSTPI
jgi:hypothetical protein